jgi:hypothetical protein
LKPTPAPSRDSKREKAAETLESLDLFLHVFISHCLKAADELEDQAFSRNFHQLLDDLMTVNELLITWSSVFSAGAHGKLQALKAELLSLVQDLEQFSNASNRAHRVTLLRNELPQFAEELRMFGIPLLKQISTS